MKNIAKKEIDKICLTDKEYTSLSKICSESWKKCNPGYKECKSAKELWNKIFKNFKKKNYEVFEKSTTDMCLYGKSFIRYDSFGCVSNIDLNEVYKKDEKKE